MVKLFIVGYPLDMTEMELIELVSAHGMLHNMVLMRDDITGKPKGYGFLEMLDKQGAERVIAALNGYTLGGRTLTVKFAGKQVRQRPTGAGLAA